MTDLNTAEFSSTETAILRSAGLDPKDIDYPEFRRNIIVILGKSYEAIFRESLSIQLYSGGDAEAHIQTHNAAVLVDALKSNLLYTYPELKVVTVNGLLKRDSRVISIALSTLFQEGQRLWLEKLNSSIVKDAPFSAKNQLHSLYEEEEEEEDEYKEDFASPDNNYNDDDVDDDVASDNEDSIKDGLEEVKLIRGSLLDARAQLHQRRARKTRKTVERRRNFIEENTKLSNLRPSKVPDLLKNPVVGVTRRRPGSAPAGRVSAVKIDATLHSKETPRGLPVKKDENGEEIVYSYDMRSGRRIVLSKDDVMRIDKLRRAENNGDVRNMSDLERNIQQQRVMEAKPPSCTRPMWPGYSTEKSATSWIERMRVLNKTSTPKESNSASPVMYIAYTRMETFDLILSIEHCTNCQHHNISLRHDEVEYRSHADAAIQTVIEAVSALAPAVRFGVNRFTSVRPVAKPRHDTNTRKGAFEVQIAFRSNSTGLKVDILHSKLVTMRWPSKSVIVKRVQTFLAQFRLGSFDSEQMVVSEYESNDSGLGINDGAKGLRHVQWLFDARSFALKSADSGPSPALVHAAPASKQSSEASSASHPSKISVPKTVTAEKGSAPSSPRPVLDAESSELGPESFPAENDSYLGAGEPEAEHVVDRADVEQMDEAVKEGPEFDEAVENVALLPSVAIQSEPPLAQSPPSQQIFQDLRLSISSFELVGKALMGADFTEVYCRLKMCGNVYTTGVSSDSEAKTNKRLIVAEFKNIPISAREFEQESAQLCIVEDPDFEDSLLQCEIRLSEFMQPIDQVFEVTVSAIHPNGIIMVVLKCSTAESDDKMKERIRNMPMSELIKVKFTPLVSYSQEEVQEIENSEISLPNIAVRSEAKVEEMATRATEDQSAANEKTKSPREALALPSIRVPASSRDDIATQPTAQPTAQPTSSTVSVPLPRGSLPLWERRTVIVSKIVASRLKSVELSAGGKNDPFVKLSFGSLWSSQTSTLRGAGKNATWRFSESNSDMRFNVEQIDLLRNTIVVAVFDENVLSSDKCIGEGRMSLDKLVHADVGVEMTFTLELSDDECGSTGSVAISLLMAETSAAPESIATIAIELDDLPEEVPEEVPKPVGTAKPAAERAVEQVVERVVEPVAELPFDHDTTPSEPFEYNEDAFEEPALSSRSAPLSIRIDEVAKTVISIGADADEGDKDNEYGDEFETEFEADDVSVTRGAESSTSAADSASDDKSALLEIHKALNGDRWDLRSNWKAQDPLSSWNCVVIDSSDPPRVTELRLGRKRLSGVLPIAIGSLQSLTVLFLYGNKIEGRIPEELFLLTNLKKLNLYDNAFVGEISPSFSTLVNLESVNLSSNKFHGQVPKELVLPQLKELFLHQNNLLGPLPMEFTTLKELAEFTSDLIPYTDFVKVFDWIVSSHRLNWEGSGDQTVASEKSALLSICEEYGKELISVTDGWTNWGSNHPLDLWRGLRLSKTGNIQSLVLRNCCMSGSIPLALSTLDKLVYLDLSLNALEGTIPDTFTALKHLQQLHLDNNNLSGELSVLASMKTLRFIDISNNRIASEIPQSFKNLTVLETLKLHNNVMEGTHACLYSRLSFSYSYA